MAVIALVVLIAVGVGGLFGYKYFAHKKAAAAAAKAAAAAAAPPEAEHEEEDEEEAPHGGEKKEGEGAAGGPAVLVLNRLIVNLDGPRKNAFLKCELHILFRNQELGKLAVSEKPTPESSIIRAIVLESLSGKTVEEAADVETRETLRSEIKEKLNEKFASRHSKEELEKAKKSGKKVKPPIKDVLVVDWAIQQ
jgi:flagellar basal body-associated protein FliL